MKTQRILVVLTIVNLGILMFQLMHTPQVEAGKDEQVLRGRALEIVDDQGKVRASIKIHSADHTYKWPNGKIGLPETVMFRLIDPNGRPEVKLGASVEGAGLGLIGDTDETQVILKTDGTDSTLKLQNKDGRQQLIKP